MAKIHLAKMIRLCIGITNMTPAWQSLFDQIGIRAEVIDFSSPLVYQYSCLIINSKLNDEALKLVYRYVKNEKGGILVTSNTPSNFKQERTTSTFSADIPYPYFEKCNPYYLGSGLIFELTFDPEKEFTNTQYVRKRFPYESGIHPDELVSKVDQKALKETIEILLKELHLYQNLPFVNKWHSPTQKPFFAFRIDTDFSDKNGIQNLYQLAEEYDIPMTWFLHVQAHEEWLDFFHSFEHQEIALHGYEHGTSSSYEHVINNIERGKQIMMDAGFNPSGFCVPYSIWNSTLGDVLKKFNFKYSSEFTLAFDTTPFYPIHKATQHSTLQIPIHPICTGSLNRKKATLHQMERYFNQVLEHKVSFFENIIFYHHPLQPGLEIWKSIFEKINKLEIPKLTFSEIADFWNLRIDSHIDLHYDTQTKMLICVSDNPKQLLKISINSEEFHILPASKINKPLDAFEAIESPAIKKPSTALLAELNRNRIQLLKTSILDWKNRKKL